MRNHTYEWDNVIVGMTLPACLYAYSSGYPIVGFQYDMPSQVDNRGSDLSQWTDLLFVLSMRGQVPFADNITSISFIEDRMRVVTKRSQKQCFFKFNKAHVFSDYMVHGMPPIISKGQLKKIYDWIDVRTIQSHDIDYIDARGTDSFLHEIHFVKTGRSNNKDICAVFYGNEKTLKDFQYSESMVRLEVQRILHSKGLTGPLKNNASDKRKTPTYSPIVLESAYREVRPSAANIYEDSDKIVSKFEMAASSRTKKNFTKDPFLVAHREDS